MKGLPVTYSHVDRDPPQTVSDAATWSRELGSWRARVIGRGIDSIAGLRRSTLPLRISPLAWLEQRHSAELAVASPGCCGEADALLLEAQGVTAAVATADCVPIAIVQGERAALVHAGWRGLAARLPSIAARRVVAADSNGAMAWIGPAIGPCCYEVGDEVAERVGAASGVQVVVVGTGGRPKLDLRLAAALQLRASGVGWIGLLDHCTRCRAEWLWSYRGDGERAGRNFMLLERRSEAG